MAMMDDHKELLESLLFDGMFRQGSRVKSSSLSLEELCN